MLISKRYRHLRSTDNVKTFFVKDPEALEELSNTIATQTRPTLTRSCVMVASGFPAVAEFRPDGRMLREWSWDWRDYIKALTLDHSSKEGIRLANHIEALAKWKGSPYDAWFDGARPAGHTGIPSHNVEITTDREAVRCPSCGHHMMMSEGDCQVCFECAFTFNVKTVPKSYVENVASEHDEVMCPFCTQAVTYLGGVPHRFGLGEHDCPGCGVHITVKVERKVSEGDCIQPSESAHVEVHDEDDGVEGVDDDEAQEEVRGDHAGISWADSREIVLRLGRISSMLQGIAEVNRYDARGSAIYDSLTGVNEAIEGVVSLIMGEDEE